MKYIILLFLLCSLSLYAGYEVPSFIDGCRSMNGQFEIMAQQTLKPQDGKSHGPNKWSFIWKDLKNNKTLEFEAQGIQGGKVKGQLFMAPDGETFAFWNHITQWWEIKSHMHGHSHKDVIRKHDQAGFKDQFVFTNRLVIYRKDGSVIKTLGAKDFLKEEEWRYVKPIFTRVEWLRPYGGMYFKNMARPSYAFTKVSPDYTVLEFQVGNPKTPRQLRVSLIDGTILAEDKTLTKEKTPVLMAGAAEVPKNNCDWLENFMPSLDPVRIPGQYRIDTIEKAFPLDKAREIKPMSFDTPKLLADGFKKADTPAWRKKWGKKPEAAGYLVFTDLETGTLYSLSKDNQKSVIKENATRGRIANKGRTFYGLIDNKIGFWDFNKKEGVLVAEGVEGRPVSLNDMVVANNGFIYFTTLKDPDKGRLSVYNPKTKKITVLFDGEDHPNLANPNGIALSPNERFLYVGISNYKNREHSGVYAFPLRGDGSIDFESGKSKPRFAVQAPDGIAVDHAGNVYFTAGPTVHVFDKYARELGKIKIPKGSGTNLCFGGYERMQKNLYITTREAVYAVETHVGIK